MSENPPVFIDRFSAYIFAFGEYFRDKLFKRRNFVLLKLQTNLEGQTAIFGIVSACVEEQGYHLGGSWDYDKGCFDHILYREGAETIYIRIPFTVLDGELDQPHAMIKFATPFVIKHVVNLGLDSDDSSLLDMTGLSQFQAPLDTDGHIEDKSRWTQAGEAAVQELVDCLLEQNYLLSG